MGMYTEIFFRAEVDEGAYRALLRGHEHERVLRSGSAYFPEVEPTGPRFYHDRLYNHYNVEFRSSLKNYDREIESFFAWVAPHCVTTNDFIGYSLYEEDRYPTLFFADGTSTKLREALENR